MYSCGSACLTVGLGVVAGVSDAARAPALVLIARRQLHKSSLRPGQHTYTHFQLQRHEGERSHLDHVALTLRE